MTAPGAVDVLAVIDAARSVLSMDANADPCDRLGDARAVVVELIEASQELSADLEHAIGLANFEKDGSVADSHPVRIALNRVDAALARCGGAQ